MEKFRVQIEFTKKWHFWILFGLIIVVSLAFWSVASAALSDMYDKRTKSLKSVEDKVRTIAQNQKHPNDKSIKDMQAIIGKDVASPNSLFVQVFKAWKGLYRSMRRYNELPDLFNAKGGNDLDKKQQQDFVTTFNGLWGPLEEIPNKDGFKDNVRDTYGNHIHQTFPLLLNLIEWRHPDASAPSGANAHQLPGMKQHGGGVAAEDKVKMVGIVDWVDSDKDKVFGRFDKWTGSPTTMQIMVAQEDLWVYESMLKVIRDTNNMSEDVKDTKYISPGTHKAARVKRILTMELGQEAVASWLKSEQSVFRAPAAAAGGPAGNNGPRIETTPKAGGNAQSDALLTNRYVDESGKPLEDSSKQPFAEFRMMPIFMRVVIEQKAITRLLAACANSSMRIDVTEVRLLTTPIGPYEPSTDNSAPAQGAPSPNMKGGMHGGVVESMPSAGGMHHGSGGSGHGQPFSSGVGAAAAVDEEDASDPVVPPVTIEVEGIAYIYNKPDFGKVGGGGGSGPDAGANGTAAHATGSDEDADSDDTDNPAETAPTAPAAGQATPEKTPAVGNGVTAPSGSASGPAAASPAGSAVPVPPTGVPAVDSSKGTISKDSGTKGTGR